MPHKNEAFESFLGREPEGLLIFAALVLKWKGDGDVFNWICQATHPIFLDKQSFRMLDRFHDLDTSVNL